MLCNGLTGETLVVFGKQMQMKATARISSEDQLRLRLLAAVVVMEAINGSLEIGRIESTADQKRLNRGDGTELSELFVGRIALLSLSLTGQIVGLPLAQGPLHQNVQHGIHTASGCCGKGVDFLRQRFSESTGNALVIGGGGDQNAPARHRQLSKGQRLLAQKSSIFHG